MVYHNKPCRRGIPNNHTGFPQIRVPFLGVPILKDLSILGSIFGPLFMGTSIPSPSAYEPWSKLL